MVSGMEIIKLVESQSKINSKVSESLLKELKTIKEVLVWDIESRSPKEEVIKPYTVSLLKNIVLQDFEESGSISNPVYDRMRLFISIAFDTGATAGISADLMYNDSVIIEDIIVVKKTADTCTGVSVPVNIEQLSGFTIMFKNRDAKDATIKESHIIMYKKGDD